MSRPRQPIALIEAKGKKHLTKEEIKKREREEIHADCDRVIAPTYLNPKQKEKFEEISSELLKIGIISNLDCDSLARYLIAEEAYQEITEILKGYDIAKNIEGYVKLTNAQDRYFRQCRTAASDLGLTISSRCRLAIPKSKEEPRENKFARFGDMSG